MDDILAFLELACAVLLWFLTKRERRYPNRRFRLVYLLPAGLGLLFSFFISWDPWFAGVYIGAVVYGFALFADTEKGRRGVILSVAGLILATEVICAFSPLYRRKDYAGEFDRAFSVLKEHYVLAREKEIEWDRLYADYKPGFEQVEKSQDEVQNYKLWLQFAQEFYDGHVGYTINSEDNMMGAACDIFGRDYGLSLIRLEDGRYAAVNVEGGEHSYSIEDKEQEIPIAGNYQTEHARDKRLTLWDAGVRNGTIITGWNGKSVEELLKEVEVYWMNYPDRENEAFFRPIYAAGLGGKEDTVEIKFLAEDGTEHTVTATALGAYAPRLLSTMEKLDDGEKISNLDWKRLDDSTVMLRIYSMAYDMESYNGTDYTKMTEELRDQLLAYKAEGVSHIILDLRRNSGGSPFMVMGVAKLFAPEGTHTDCYTAVVDEKTASYKRGEDGKYIKGEPLTYEGEDLWKDGRITLLVNAETVSAGDEMTYLFSEFPNATVMGYTKSNSSCQAVSSIELDGASFSYSAVPNLDPEGNPLIDTFSDHVGRVPLDVRVPVDQEMLRMIFDRGEDHLLNAAMKH